MKATKKKITMIVEKTDTGFSAFSNDYPIFTTGRTIPELIDNALEASQLYFEDEKIKIERENLKLNHIALIRLEQLFPLAENKIKAVLKKYTKAEKFIWAQEEPENMGAWSYIRRSFKFHDLELISRRASGSPASGSHKIYDARQKAIIDKVLSK